MLRPATQGLSHGSEAQGPPRPGAVHGRVTSDARGDLAAGGRTPCWPAAPRTPAACVFQEFADSVSQLVTQKFRELTVGLASAHARHKALAGIVMTQGNAPRASRCRKGVAYA